MYDTVAAFIEPLYPLPDSVFTGGVLQFVRGSNQAVARLYHNPDKDASYAPRLTYWRTAGSANPDVLSVVPPEDVPDQNIPANGLLKCEFSLPKWYARLHPEWEAFANLRQPQAVEAVNAVDDWLETTLDRSFPSFATWRVQRMDYAFNWHVGAALPVYLSVFNQLRISTASRHPYDRDEGVLWKLVSRWFKFYNKTLKELGKGQAPPLGVLRFEVSNYVDACRRMAKSWFQTERVVHQFLHEGRALYILARAFDQLGLSSNVEYAAPEREDYLLRECFGSRAPQAAWVLKLLRSLGSEAYKDPHNLVSSSMFYAYRSKLAATGLIAIQGRKDVDMYRIPPTLPALHLPVTSVWLSAATPQNLEASASPPGYSEKEWRQKIASDLGVPAGKSSGYILRRLKIFASQAGKSADEERDAFDLSSFTTMRNEVADEKAVAVAQAENAAEMQVRSFIHEHKQGGDHAAN